MDRELPFRLVDAFTRRPFEGNRAGVVLEAGGLSDAQCLAIAREVAASETAFVEERGGGRFRVRFFTPALEIPFCGHATLAAFLVLEEEGRLAAAAGGRAGAVMECAAGELPIEVQRGEGGVRVRQRQAAYEEREAGALPGDAAALHGLGPSDLAEGGAVASTGCPFLLLPLADAGALARARPAEGLADLQRRLGAPGTILFVRPGPEGFDAHVRCFAPASGIAEDPATGTGAGALAGWLASHAGAARDGVARYRFLQGTHVGRRSELDTEVRLLRGFVSEVAVLGKGVVTVRGTIRRP